MSSMLPPVDPIGGDDGMPVPTGSFNQAGPGIGREFQVDARTIAEAVAAGDESASDDIDHSGYQVTEDTTSIGGETRRGGWKPNTEPVGGTPARANTSGSRGAADIGRI